MQKSSRSILKLLKQERIRLCICIVLTFSVTNNIRLFALKRHIFQTLYIDRDNPGCLTLKGVLELDKEMSPCAAFMRRDVSSVLLFSPLPLSQFSITFCLIVLLCLYT